MYNYLFGPVPSRRLGMSLGIDLVPRKVCSLDCVYCEVGKTTKLTTERREYVKYDKVIAELVAFMRQDPPIDYITFSGSGEPTLNSRIGEVLAFVKAHYPTVKTAVLTNGTLLSDKTLRQELCQADVILPSLDAAGQEAFERINGPVAGLLVQDYIDGLIALRQEFKGKIYLEVLFLKHYNDAEDDLRLLKAAIAQIKPDRIQLNTLDRPGRVEGLMPLSHEDLQGIKDFWAMDNVEIIASQTTRTKIPSYHKDVASAILETIARRPCTLDDLHRLLGLHPNEINKYLGTLETEGRITTQGLARGVFYELKNK